VSFYNTHIGGLVSNALNQSTCKKISASLKKERLLKPLVGIIDGKTGGLSGGVTGVAITSF